jgi:hypothetical protein
MLEVLPGDVLVVRHSGGRPVARAASWSIRFGAWLAHQPTGFDHVIVAHHVDAAGTFQGIEGRPGGVGWVDIRPWLADPNTVANHDQPKTAAQRALLVETLPALLGVRYDWEAIAADTVQVVAPLYARLEPVWRMRDSWGVGIPGHVVCSSAADWVYERAGLPTPKADRFCTPANWAGFIAARGWETK